MGSLRTLVSIVLIGLMPALQARPVFAVGDDTLLRLFAGCAGRLSAMVEHQWLWDGIAADQTARHRAAMLALMEAVLVPEAEVQAMRWRLEAKAAQAALLSRAAFRSEPWAARRAETLLRNCVALIGQS